MNETCPNCLSKERDRLALMRMLVKRATWRDKWLAHTHPGHWLNVARREIFVEHGTLDPIEIAAQQLNRIRLDTSCLGCQQAQQRIKEGWGETSCHLCGCWWMSKAAADDRMDYL